MPKLPTQETPAPTYILKLQLKTPISTPVDVYSFVDYKRHRAHMTVREYGVDVLIQTAPNRPTSAYHHFFVPWANVMAMFYGAPEKAKGTPESAATDAEA